MSLGIREEELFEVHDMQIEVGDSLYFMTDGLTDLLDGTGDLPLSQYPEMVAILREWSKAPQLDAYDSL